MARPPGDINDEFRPTPNRRSEDDLPAFRPARKRGRAGLLDRDNLVGAARTTAWLAPLTLLIWVYAEQQQEFRGKVNTVPVTLQSAVPNRYVEFVGPLQQQTVTLTLSGPREKVGEVSSKLLEKGLPLEVGSRGAGAGQRVDVVAAVQSMTLFRGSGVTVVESDPPELSVNVDNVKEVPATIELGAHTAQLSGITTFDPPRVVVRGPQTQLDRLVHPDGTANGKLVVYADLSKFDEQLRRPGDQTLTKVPLVLPGQTDQIRIDPPLLNNAKVQVAAASERKTIEAVPILVTASPDVWHDYDVRLGDGDLRTIQSVTVIGPADRIDDLLGQNGQPARFQATAEVRVQLQGFVHEGTVVPTFNLPDGVHVVPDDANRPIPYKLIRRDAANGG